MSIEREDLAMNMTFVEDLSPDKQTVRALKIDMVTSSIRLLA